MPKSLPAVASLALLLLFFSAAHAGTDSSPLSAARQGSIRSVRITDGGKPVALTFDLCEGPREKSGFDADLVGFLQAHGIKATFFAGGKWMRSHPRETAQLMLEPLFEIGAHGWDHRNFRAISPGEAREQLARIEEQYRAVRSTLAERPVAAGERLRLFRFPYGACRSESLALLASVGMQAIQWSIVSGDPAVNRTAVGIINTVMNQVKPGSIVIFHANGKGHGTLDALRSLAPRLGSMGYEFVTVSELLDRGEPISADECYETKPGDTARYDRLGGK